MTPTSIPWYETEDDFKAILSSLPVSESHNALSYAEWIARIQKLEQDAVSRGQMPVRVTVKPAAIKEWCQTSNLPFCRKSIAAYAMFKMANPIVERGSN